MRPNPELTKRIVALYNDGERSISSVAKEVGLVSETVRYHLVKGGAKRRKQGDCIVTRLGACDPRLVAIEHPTTLDIAWAAGIFEGEGSISIHRTATVSVAQKDRWLCDKLLRLFGGHITMQQQLTSGRTEPITMYYWQVNGTRARGFLMTIYKFLSPRRQARAREAIQ